MDRLEALALQDRGGEAAAFAALADRRQGAVAGQLAEPPRQLAVGDVERAGDVARRRTRRRRARRATSGGSVASSSSASCVGADRLDPLHRAFLRPPGAHAAAEEAAHPQPDRGEQLGGLQLVAVGGRDDDDLGLGGTTWATLVAKPVS